MRFNCRHDQGPCNRRNGFQGSFTREEQRTFILLLLESCCEESSDKKDNKFGRLRGRAGDTKLSEDVNSAATTDI